MMITVSVLALLLFLILLIVLSGVAGALWSLAAALHIIAEAMRRAWPAPPR